MTIHGVQIIVRITGSISATASSLIIYLILRSDFGLSSIYHRIMFGMSCADIISSIAMALASLPMPNDFPCEDDDLFAYNGKGNIQTCEAQGFFISFGLYMMYSYYAMLSFYYVCDIAFQMNEETIRKRVEPYIHSIPIILALIGSLPPVFLNLYNPDLLWCKLEPIDCTAKDEISGNEYQYVRGARQTFIAFYAGGIVIFVIIYITIVASFSLIVRNARITDNQLLNQ